MPPPHSNHVGKGGEGSTSLHLQKKIRLMLEKERGTRPLPKNRLLVGRGCVPPHTQRVVGRMSEGFASLTHTKKKIRLIIWKGGEPHSLPLLNNNDVMDGWKATTLSKKKYKLLINKGTEVPHQHKQLQHKPTPTHQPTNFFFVSRVEGNLIPSIKLNYCKQ